LNLIPHSAFEYMEEGRGFCCPKITGEKEWVERSKLLEIQKKEDQYEVLSCCLSIKHTHTHTHTHKMKFLWNHLFLLSLCLVKSTSALAAPLPPLTNTAEHIPLAGRAMEFFDSSSDPFHAVQTSIDMLAKAGFEELDDIAPYEGKIQPGGKYYFTRNKSTLVAFSVGKDFVPGNGGFKVIGAHTDSPNLRVKPRSKRSAKGAKSIQLGVECYGGGLWHTWFDRDLGLSGRVMTSSSAAGKETGSMARTIEQKLVKIDRALLRIPNLAIHLQTADERKAFAVNKEDHLSPILAMAAQKALTGGKENDDDSKDEGDTSNEGTKDDKEENDGWKEYQEPLLLQVLASELGVSVEEIVDFELNLFDIQKSTLGGYHSEFLHSARLDNLASCFLAVEALIEYVEGAGSEATVEAGSVVVDRDISMIVLYDHEEVGSTSA
jgi:aspartyl aminopeptidase